MIAYKVEAWLLGGEGGARWMEVRQLLFLARLCQLAKFYVCLISPVGNHADQRVRRVQFATRRRVQISRDAAKSVRMGRVGDHGELVGGERQHRLAGIHENPAGPIESPRRDAGETGMRGKLRVKRSFLFKYPADASRSLTLRFAAIPRWRCDGIAKQRR